MKKALTILSLLGLCFSFNLAANYNEGEPTAEHAKKHHFWHKIKQFKLMHFKKALSDNGVDEATSDKAVEGLKTLMQEKKMKYKEYKKKFRADVLNSLVNAGIPQITADKVIKDYHAAIKAAGHKFMEKVKPIVHEAIEKVKQAR